MKTKEQMQDEAQARYPLPVLILGGHDVEIEELHKAEQQAFIDGAMWALHIKEFVEVQYDTKTDSFIQSQAKEPEFGSESIEEAMRVLIDHAKECESRYGISGDAVIEMGEMVLAKHIQPQPKDVPERSAEEAAENYVNGLGQDDLKLAPAWDNEVIRKYAMHDFKAGFKAGFRAAQFTPTATANKWDSTAIIGRVHERFDELKHKEWDWRSFYNGWLEGRVDMAFPQTKQELGPDAPTK